MQGPLEVTLIGANGLKNKELFTRQDPYCIVEYGGQKFRTKTDNDGGTNPAFNANITLRLQPGLNEFTVVIWNENVTRDDVIGSTRINFHSALQCGLLDSWFPVYDKKQKQHGTLHVLLKYPPALYGKQAAPAAGAAAATAAYAAAAHPSPPVTHAAPPPAYAAPPPAHAYPAPAAPRPYAPPPAQHYAPPPAYPQHSAYPPQPYPYPYPQQSYYPAPYYPQQHGTVIVTHGHGHHHHHKYKGWKSKGFFKWK